MSQSMVLTEDEALEILTFLVTAARTQVDEPKDYGTLRLLTAAQRLSNFIIEQVSPDTQRCLESLLEEIPHGQRRTTDFDGYLARLDDVCRIMAQHLVERTDLEEESP